ncbi:hypothetical protein D3C83_299800 [compost metagenome]
MNSGTGVGILGYGWRSAIDDIDSLTDDGSRLKKMETSRAATVHRTRAYAGVTRLN